MNEPTNQNDTVELIEAELTTINQKLDCILSELSGLKLRMNLDEQIDSLHNLARSMREGNAVEE